MSTRIGIRVVGPVSTVAVPGANLQSELVSEHLFTPNDALSPMASLMNECGNCKIVKDRGPTDSVRFYIAFDDRRFPPIEVRNAEISLADFVGPNPNAEERRLTLFCAVRPAGLGESAASHIRVDHSSIEVKQMNSFRREFLSRRISVDEL